ncbi:MAG: MBL fold metallo-hydrolase, partial [Caldilineaceae bacterium]
MFELVFLGTSASAPSVQRGLSSAIVMHNEHRFMIDCGEGTQRQLLRSGLGFRRLDKILLTHGHLDHILGLGGLASTLGRWEALEELHIFAGAPALTRVAALMDVVFGAGQVP